MLFTNPSFDIDYPSFDAFLETTVPNADGLVSNDGGFEIIEKVPFTADDITAVNNYFNSLTAAGELAKNTPTMQHIVSQKILNRMAFGQQVMAGYGAHNILAGFSTSQVTQIAGQLANIQALIQSGSLETARTLISQITPSDLIPQTSIDFIVNKITVYLNAGN